MRAASLLAVLVLTKVIVLAGHDVPLAWWSPIAYLWQDAALVLVFAGVEFMVASRRRLAWAAYAAVALYAVVNIPVMRVLSTPLTWSMWGAARGPLADSLRHDATWQNVLLLLLTAAAVIVLAPLVLRLMHRSEETLLVVEDDTDQKEKAAQA